MGEARNAWCVLAEVRWRRTSIVERLRAILPVLVPPDASFLWNPEHRELFMSGLRLAAGEVIYQTVRPSLSRSQRPTLGEPNDGGHYDENGPLLLRRFARRSVG
jgi:hypothetical protein